MRRTSLRVSALLLTVLFLATAAREALGLGACPHHDGGLAGALHDPGAAAHAEHAAGAAAHHPAVHPDPGTAPLLREACTPVDHGGRCTCIGACHLTPSAPLPGVGETAWHPLASISANSTAPEARATLPGPAPFLLPYATAPPLAR